MRKLMLMGWIFPFISAFYLCFSWGLKKGFRDGRAQFDKPSLRMTRFSDDEIQLVIIKQRMTMGDFGSQRVEIDVSGIDGLEGKRFGSMGSGSESYFDEVSIWRIKNNTDANLSLSEAEFTNLPNDYKIPKEFENAFVIPPTPSI